MLGQEFLDKLWDLPVLDRVAVVQVVLRQAGRDVEQTVLRRQERLVARGVAPHDSWVSAFETALREPGGDRILRVLAKAGAEGAVERGLISPQKENKAASRFHSILREADDMEPQEGLGWVEAVVDIASQVLTLGIGAIIEAVHKAREKRRAFKAEMTPLNDEENAQVAALVASEYASFEEGEVAATGYISQIRSGRPDYLVQPKKGMLNKEGKQDKPEGKVVNERKRLKDAFKRVRTAVVERQEMDFHLAQALRRKKETMIGGGLAAGGVVGLLALYLVLH